MSAPKHDTRHGRDHTRQIEAEEHAAAYAAMRSFAASTLGRGESEGLYRTVDDLLLRGLIGRRPAWILDVGCGTGRTLVDAATAFPDAVVVGLDRDAGALLIAHAIAHFRGAAVTADLRRWGFGVRSIAAYNLKNVLLVAGCSECLPFLSATTWRGFDAVTCVNLLDRTDDAEASLREIARVLAPGGILVLASPLNWRALDGAAWTHQSTLESLTASVSAAQMDVEEAFDGLVYREVIDIRGSITDWRVAVLRARRRLNAQPALSGQSTLL